MTVFLDDEQFLSGPHPSPSTAADRPRTKRILVFAIKHTCHFRLDGAHVPFLLELREFA